ncbi:NAD(P)-dependent alcohol dehydrogenase [Nonomuraea sp. NPDC048826]|uniref:NAD(P)-dependent alcohol dehydrogenase n=1 Tax=Nonomuraea sp. NPDC048826 TaxID=3364347 RepID=UPI0037153836
MRAIVQEAYGSLNVLKLRDVPLPEVKDDEVLVRVRAASVHPDVWHVVSGKPYVLRLMGSGLRRPKVRVPGTDMAGVVESTGANATRFRPGDEVFGETLRAMQWKNGGAFAEYVSVPQDNLSPKPGNVSFEQAATVPTAGLITLMNLPTGPLRNVLVNGAAGGVGGLAVQIAKARGATVTGVEHTSKLDLARELGADHVIDYTKEDFTRLGTRYDLVFDIPGNHSFAACRRALTPDGTYVLIGHDHYGATGHPVLGSVPRMVKLMAQSLFLRQLPKPTRATPPRKESMAVLAELLETGRITPVIDRAFPLAETASALRYLTEGTARGRIVVTL